MMRRIGFGLAIKKPSAASIYNNTHGRAHVTTQNYVGSYLATGCVCLTQTNLISFTVPFAISWAWAPALRHSASDVKWGTDVIELESVLPIMPTCIIRMRTYSIMITLSGGKPPPA